MKTPSRRSAPVRHPVHELIRDRWSPRALAPDPVDPRVLASIFEAAAWAPSAFNSQPWRFLVATSEVPAAFAQLRGLLDPGNAWALAAPVLVLSACRTKSEHDGSPMFWALRDLGAAEQNACLEAVHQGLVMHLMAGFDRAAAQKLVGDDFEPVTMFVIAHPGDPTALTDWSREAEDRPRQRRPLDETVFLGDWGSAAPWA